MNLIVAGVLIGVVAVFVGMACMAVAFIVFRPIINTYANAIAVRLRAAEKAEKAEPAAEPKPVTVRDTKEPKKEKVGTIKRAVRDVEEEIST